MDETLTFADGTVLNSSHVIESGHTLYFYIRDPEHGNIADVFEILTDPDRTSAIVAVQYGDEQVFTGYNRLYCLRDEDDGMITAGMRKE